MGRALKCPFVDVKEAAKFLHLKQSTLHNMRWNGQGPKYRKHGRKVVYHRDELKQWSLRREEETQPRGKRASQNV